MTENYNSMAWINSGTGGGEIRDPGAAAGATGPKAGNEKGPHARALVVVSGKAGS